MEASQHTGGSLETGTDLGQRGTGQWLRPVMRRLDAGSAEFGGSSSGDSQSDFS